MRSGIRQSSTLGSGGMMTLEGLDAFCGSLPATAHGVQWGGASVWKVGAWADGRVFAIANDGAVSFKVSEIGWEILGQTEGCRPAPYLASRGLRWIQADYSGGLPQADIRDYVRSSHALIVAGLSRRRRQLLGLA